MKTSRGASDGALQRMRKSIVALLTVGLIASSLVLAAPIAGAQAVQAVDDSIDITAGELAQLDVLTNDLLDGPVTLAIVRAPATGTAEVNRDGTAILFDAPTGFAGDVLVYEITPERGDPSQATVTLNLDVSCGDVTLTPAQGGDALEDAIVAANRCPGAQTIFLERGQYSTDIGFSAIEDDLTVTALDPALPPEIINQTTGTTTATFRVTNAATFELSSVKMFDRGALMTHVFVLNASAVISDVEMIGDDAPRIDDAVSSILGDNANLRITNAEIRNADSNAITGRNGTTVFAQGLTITNPAGNGVAVDGDAELNEITVDSAGQSGVLASSRTLITKGWFTANAVAGIELQTAEQVTIAATSIGVDRDGNALPNEFGITGWGDLILDEVTIAKSQQVGLETTTASTLETNGTTFVENVIGLRLVDTAWTASDTSVASLTQSCELTSSTVTNVSGNSDTDGTCFPVPNNAPFAEADEATASPGETISVDVLANDSDVDADILTVTSTTSPNATAAVDGLSIEYTAPADFAGEVFSYEITDGTDTAIADVTVNLVCGDVTLTEAEGGAALAAAVEAANNCSGAQTILLEPGTYVITGTLRPTDSLTIAGADPANRTEIQLGLPNSGLSGYVFDVRSEGSPFTARNLVVDSGELIGLAYLSDVEALIDNVSYVGEPTSCRQGSPAAVQAIGAAVTVTNSTIAGANCGGVRSIDGSTVTVVDTTISRTAGSGINDSDGVVAVTGGAFHANTVHGISGFRSVVSVDRASVFDNGDTGINVHGTTTVTNSFIGVRLEGDQLIAAGNSSGGIFADFGDLVLANTVVAHNTDGVRAGNQAQWTTLITDSTIRDNAGFGLRLGPNNQLGVLDGTAIADNGTDCAFNSNVTITDNGGNSDSDGTCDLSPPPCGDVTLSPADDPGALSDAIAATNECPGPQTIYLQPGEHQVSPTTPITDDLTVLSVDPSDPAVITPFADSFSTFWVFDLEAATTAFALRDVDITTGPRFNVLHVDTAATVDLERVGIDRDGCPGGIDPAILIGAGTLTIRDSLLRCRSILAIASAELMIIDSEIADVLGDAVRAGGAMHTIENSVIHGASGNGIYDDGTTNILVVSSAIYGNGRHGISADIAVVARMSSTGSDTVAAAAQFATGSQVTVRDSFLGIDPTQPELEVGNGQAGVLVATGDLIVENSTIANNRWGVYMGGQGTPLTGSITNSTVRDNTDGGVLIRSGPTMTVTDTGLTGNTPNCDAQFNSTIIDGGGNTADDDTCGWGSPPPGPIDPPQVLDQLEGTGNHVLVVVADDGSITDVAVSSVAGTATEGIDFANVAVAQVGDEWLVSADLLDDDAADGTKTIVLTIVITSAEGTSETELTVNVADADPAPAAPPVPGDYSDPCAARSSALDGAIQDATAGLFVGLDNLGSLPLLGGNIGQAFSFPPPAPPVTSGCQDRTSNGATVTNAAIEPGAPLARTDAAGITVGDPTTVNLLANDGHVDGLPMSVVPQSRTVDGVTIEIGSTGVATVTAGAATTTTVDYEVCAEDSCTTSQLTVHAGASGPSPLLQPDWISVNGGSSRSLDVTRNDFGTPPLSVAAVGDTANVSTQVAGPLVGVQADLGISTTTASVVDQTVCTPSGECGLTQLTILTNPDGAPVANRDIVSVAMENSTAVSPGSNDRSAAGEPLDGVTDSFEIPSVHQNNIAVTAGAGQFTVTALSGFRGAAAFLYETCDGAICSTGVVEVLVEATAAPAATGDSFEIDTRDLYLSGAVPGVAVDVVGPAGGGADAVYGGAPELAVVTGGSITNGGGTEVAVIIASAPDGLAGQSNSLFVVPVDGAQSEPKDGASGVATYEICIAGTSLCDTAELSVTLAAAPLPDLDQDISIPLWRVDNSGVSLEARPPLFEAFNANAGVDDRQNGYLLSVLSEYVYEEIGGDRAEPFGDRFNAAFAGSGLLPNAAFYESDYDLLGDLIDDGAINSWYELLTDAQVVVVETDTAVLVAARGSQSPLDSPLDWINDLSAVPLDDMHAGFRLQAEAVREAVLADLASRPGDKPVWFAGHSLGGAIAQVLASWNTSDARVVTFGSPSVFQADTDHLVPPTMRYVNGNDPVPSAVPSAVFPHRGSEIWITGGATGCVANGPRPVGPHLNFADHSMSRYMPRMLRLLSVEQQEDMLTRYMPFAWQKWDAASGSACDAPMSVARKDVVGTWQWGIAPQATESPAADEFPAGAWLLSLDDRLTEAPGGLSESNIATALEDAFTWTVDAARGDVVFDPTTPADQTQWLYRPIAVQGQPWEPSPLSGDDVEVTFSGCNPWTAVCGTGTFTIGFASAVSSEPDMVLASDDVVVDVVSNDPEPRAGTLAAGATITTALRSIDGTVVADGQSVDFLGGEATIPVDGLTIDVDFEGLRPPITVLDHQVCSQVIVPGASTRGTFEACSDSALWLFADALPGLPGGLNITAGPCDAVLDPGDEVSVTATTELLSIAGAGSAASLPSDVTTILEALGVDVGFRWSADADLITQVGIDNTGPFLGTCSGLVASVTGDATVSIDPTSVVGSTQAYASGAGSVAVAPETDVRLDGTIPALAVASEGIAVVGANTSIGPVELDADALLFSDGGQIGSEIVIAGRLTLPGLSDDQGATRLDMTGTVQSGVVSLNGAGTIDGRSFYLDGFRLENVQAAATIDTSTNSVSGTILADIVIDVLNLSVPITFSFVDDAWTLSSNWSPGSLSIGDSPRLLEVIAPVVRIGASGDAGNQTMNLDVEFSAASATVLPDGATIVGGGLDTTATATGIAGRITGSGFINLTADTVEGSLAGNGLRAIDPFFQIDLSRPEGLIASFTRLEALVADDDVASVEGVRIYADGRVEIDGACVAPEGLIGDVVPVGMLPVRITEACILTGSAVPPNLAQVVSSDAIFVEVSGYFDFALFTELNPQVTIGGGPENTFTFSAAYDSGYFIPWDLGPIDVSLGPTGAGGVQASATASVVGYDESVLDGTISGTGGLTIDIPGVAQGSLDGSLDGFAFFDDTGALVFNPSITVDGSIVTAGGNPLLSIESLAARVDVYSETFLDNGEITAVNIDASVHDLLGRGTLDLRSPDGTTILGSTLQVQDTDPGVWRFDLIEATTGDLDWFELTDASGNLIIDTNQNADPILQGTVTADADIEIGAQAPIGVDVTAGASWDGAVMNVDFGSAINEPLVSFGQITDIGRIAEITGLTGDVRGGVGFNVATETVERFDLRAEFSANTAALFPDDEDFSVIAAGVSGSADGNGATLSATSVIGQFGPDTALIVGPAELTILNSDSLYQVLSVDQATLTSGTSTATVSGVVVWSDGTVTFDNACATDDTGLLDSNFAIAGALPFDVTEVCVKTTDLPDGFPADATFASIKGTFDFSAIAELNPSLTIGSGALADAANPDTFEISIIIEGNSVRPWDAGPITLNIGPAEYSGVTVQGGIALGGYTDGVFEGNLAGLLAADLTLPGVTSASLQATAAGDITIGDTGGNITGTLTVAASAQPDPDAVVDGALGDGVGFVSLTNVDAIIDFQLEATQDPQSDEWSVAPTINLRQASGAGTLGFVGDQGESLFIVDIAAGYTAGVWDFAAEGAAASTSFEAFAIENMTGAITVDTNVGADPIIAGTLGATALVDLDGANNGNEPLELTATATATYDGTLLAVDFSSQVEQFDVVIDGLINASELNVSLNGDAVFNVETLTPVSANLSASIDVASATLFPGDTDFSVTATGVSGTLDRTGLSIDVDGISGQFGEFDLTIGAASLTIGGQGVYPILTVASATLNNDQGGATVEGVTVFSDGTVSFGSGCLTANDGFAETLGIGAILPFDVVQACITSDPDADRVFYSIEGTFDLSSLEAALGDEVTVQLTIGDRTVGDPDAPDDGTWTLVFVGDADGIRPWDLGPIELVVSDVGVGPFAGDFGLTIGGYSEGVLAGLYDGQPADFIPPAGDAPLLGGSFEVSVEAPENDGGVQAEVGIGASVAAHAVRTEDLTTIYLNGRIEGSGGFGVDDIGLYVENLGVDFAMSVGLNPTTNTFTAPAITFSAENAGIGSVTVDALFITATGEDVKLFPSEGTFAEVGSISMAFTGSAEALAGWGGGIKDFSVQYDQDTSAIRVCAGADFSVSVTAGQEPDLFSWMPLTISEASIELPPFEPDPECDSIIDRLGNFAEAKIIASLSLGNTDEWPINASVDGIGIDLALLTDYAAWVAAGAEGTPPPFPITQLEGVAFGLAPTDFGPLTLGGQIGVGFVLDDAGRPVWYGRLAGTGQWNNIGVSLDIGLSQYGPMWATITTPFVIPLGPTGFTISGIGGGLAFDRPWPTVAADCGDPVPVDDDGKPLCVLAEGLVDAAIFELKQAAPSTQAEILALVQDKADKVGAALNDASLAEQVWAFMPTSLTLNLHGSINHATGVIDGTVTLGGNIDVGDINLDAIANGGESEIVPDLALLGKGEVSVFGFEGAELGIMIDFENPIEPTFAVALAVPGDGTLANFVPGGAVFSGTLETTGMYSAMYLVARELAVRLVAGSTGLPGADDLMETIAARMRANPNSPLAQLLLEGQPDDVTIDGAFVQQRVLALMPETGTNLEAQALEDLQAGAKVAEAFVAEVFDALANGAPVPIDPNDAPTDPNGASAGPIFVPPAPDVDPAVIGDAFKQLILDLFDEGLLDVALDAMDPRLRLYGEAGIEVFGQPVGPQQELELVVDKDALTFGYQGSVAALIDPRLVLLIQDDTQVRFQVPWDLDGVIRASLGSNPPAPADLALNPFTGDWAAGLDSNGFIVGLPYSLRGLVVPAGQADFVDELLGRDAVNDADSGPANGPAANPIPIADETMQALRQDGGMFLDGTLSLPRFFADPEMVIDDLTAARCTQFSFDQIIEQVQNLGTCFDIVTATEPLAAAQMYLPNPGGVGPAALDAAFEDFYLRGQLEEFSVLGFPLVTVADGDQVRFQVDSDGLKIEGEVEPLLEAVDRDGDGEVDGYRLNLELSFVDKPLPLDFDILEIELEDEVRQIIVPRLGGEVTITGEDVEDMLDLVGLEGSGLSSSAATVTLRGYTPNYAPNSDDPLQVDGGIEVALGGSLNGAFGGLVTSDPGTTVAARVAATYAGGPTPNLRATLTADGPLTVGEVVLTNGTIVASFDAASGKLTVTFDGSVTIPNLGEVDATGVLVLGTVPRAELTLTTDELSFGAATVSGVATLTATPDTFVTTVTGITDPITNKPLPALITVDGWGQVAINQVTIASNGTFSFDLDLDDFGHSGDLVWIDDPGLVASFSPSDGLTGHLRGVVELDIRRTTASANATGKVRIDLEDLPTLEDFPITSNATFEHEFEFALVIDEFDFGTASVGVGRQSDGTLWAEVNSTVDLDDLGVEGEITITDLRFEFNGQPPQQVPVGGNQPLGPGGFTPIGLANPIVTSEVSGTARVTITEPVGIDKVFTLTTEDSSRGRVIKLSSGGSWIASDGSWRIDLSSLSDDIDIDGPGNPDDGIKLTSGFIEASPHSGGVTVTFDGTVAIESLDTTVGAAGTVNTAAPSVDLTVTSDQLRIGPAVFSGGMTLDVTPTLWQFGIAPNSSVSVDGWGEANTATGTTISSGGSFDIDLTFPTIGGSSDVVQWINPSLDVEYTSSGTFKADVGGTIRLNVDVGGSDPVFDLDDLSDLSQITIPAAGNGSFSESFELDLAIGPLDFGDANFSLSRSGSGGFALQTGAKIDIGLLPVGTLNFTQFRLAFDPGTGASVSGTVRAQYPGVDVTMAIRTINGDVIELRAGNAYIRSNGQWSLPLNPFGGSFFTSLGRNRTVRSVFEVGGETTASFDVTVHDYVDDVACTIGGSNAAKSGDTFSRDLGPGVYSVKCTATDNYTVFGVARTDEDTQRFQLIVIREPLEIQFDQPDNFVVALTDPDSSGLMTVYWQDFDVVNNTGFDCATDSTEEINGSFARLGLGDYSITCTATNADYDSVPVERVFTVSVLEPLVLGGWVISWPVGDTGGDSSGDKADPNTRAKEPDQDDAIYLGDISRAGDSSGPKLGDAVAGTAERAQDFTELPKNSAGQPVAEQGQELGMTGTASAGSSVWAYLNSDPVLLGTTVADANGSWTIRAGIPLDMALGVHTIEINWQDDEGRNISSLAAIEVVAAGSLAGRGQGGIEQVATSTETTSSIPTEPPKPPLATTGGEHRWLIALGLLLLGFGATMGGLGRRSRRR